MSDENLGSTNITDIVNNNTEEDDEIVNKILGELDDNESEDFNENFEENNIINNNEQMEMMEPQQNYNLEQQSSNQNNNSLVPDLSINSICDLLKYPVVIFIISLAINNPVVNKHLLNITFFTDNNNLNIIGYCVQAFLISILFLIVNQFVLVNI
jgi:hypothetical protein|tara:strand:+ start:13 stop:477 length:465 start_codon:yes stop_codon:yes gene_type:complete